MLRLELPELEYYNESTQMFGTLPSMTLEFEHSLFAVSKWETLYEKAFLGKVRHSAQEMLDYIQCMRLDDGPIQDLYRLTQEQFATINQYMDKRSTATTFHERPGGRAGAENVTSELMYYWMTVYQIPFEADRWHLNRFMALVKICGIKNSPQKKMRRSEILASNRALNEQRLKQLGTTG